MYKGEDHIEVINNNYLNAVLELPIQFVSNVVSLRKTGVKH